MQTVYIALGSNLENPLEQLKQAVEKLKNLQMSLKSARSTAQSLSDRKISLIMSMR